jgi:hypothetical protein
MNPFVTFKDTDKKGELQYYILQREYPHYVGQITYYPSGEAICQVPVSGHNLYVTFAGVLRGNYIPAYPKVNEEITAITHAMALWFYSKRVAIDPKRYKKWAIKPTPL